MEDIAPTLLHVMGESVPSYMDGRVLAGSEVVSFFRRGSSLKCSGFRFEPTSITSNTRSTGEFGVLVMHILHVACMPYPSMQGSQVYLRGLMKAQAKRHNVSLLCYGHGTECTDQGLSYTEHQIL